MKIRKGILGLLALIGVMSLAGCAKGGEVENSKTKEPAGQTQTGAQEGEDSNVLSFLETGKARIELYDMDVNVSYGNQALSQQVNVTTLSNTAHITFSANTTENDVYCIVIVAEKVGTENLHTRVNKEIEGSNLLNFQELMKDELVGYDKAFVSITKGTAIKWTKGLSTKLDDKIRALSGQQN